MVVNLSAKYLQMTRTCFQNVKIIKKSERELNEHLTLIKKWAFHWKMDLNPDPKKQAIEVCFSHKIVSNSPRPPSFKQSQVKILAPRFNSR